jgi:hypothetical protein
MTNAIRHVIASQTGFLLGTLLVAHLVCTSWAFAASSLPSFQVIGQDKTALSILVPKNTTTEQLKTLILEFRSARQSHTLSKMIPPTTKGGSQGDYWLVWIFVFSEPEWATQDRLKKFINASMKSESDMQFSKEYGKHVKAEYFYSHMEEYGNVGYKEGSVRTPNYKKLF